MRVAVAHTEVRMYRPMQNVANISKMLVDSLGERVDVVLLPPYSLAGTPRILPPAGDEVKTVWFLARRARVLLPELAGNGRLPVASSIVAGTNYYATTRCKYVAVPVLEPTGRIKAVRYKAVMAEQERALRLCLRAAGELGPKEVDGVALIVEEEVATPWSALAVLAGRARMIALYPPPEWDDTKRHVVGAALSIIYNIPVVVMGGIYEYKGKRVYQQTMIFRAGGELVKTITEEEKIVVIEVTNSSVKPPLGADAVDRLVSLFHSEVMRLARGR